MKFLFVGDVMLGRLVNDILRERPPVYPWGNTLSIFQGVDVRICNLECVISDKGTPWLLTPKVFHFGSDARNVETLKIAGIDAVSLANNHALDYGYDAMLDMLKILDDAGIHHAGADVVFGHSCHVFQGIEIYNDHLIIYSAGDFIDDYAVDEIERNDQSFIFTLETHNSKIFRLRLYPTVISDFQARLATQSEAKEIMDKMQQLCAEFKTPAKCDEKEGCIEILVSS